MPDGLGRVEIGAREIYDAVVSLRGAVDRLNTHTEEIQRDVQDHEVRLRVLERGRWPLPALTLIVAVASVAVAVFYR